MAEKNSNPPVTVQMPQMPSADLITYRFDQNDRNLKDLKDEVTSRLDKLTNSFVTKDEHTVVSNLVQEHDTALKILVSDTDRVKGAITLLKVIVAILTTAGVVLGGLWWTR